MATNVFFDLYDDGDKLIATITDQIVNVTEAIKQSNGLGFVDTEQIQDLILVLENELFIRGHNND
jgi:hypothetical protein